MKLNWNFLERRVVQNKRPSVGGGGGEMDIFCNSTICILNKILDAD